MMDNQTLSVLNSFMGSGTPTNVVEPDFLTPTEMTTYKHIQRDNLCLEQEHILPSFG